MTRGLNPGSAGHFSGRDQLTITRLVTTPGLSKFQRTSVAVGHVAFTALMLQAGKKTRVDTLRQKIL